MHTDTNVISRSILKYNYVDREEKAFLESRDPGWWSRRITELAGTGKVSGKRASVIVVSDLRYPEALSTASVQRYI